MTFSLFHTIGARLNSVLVIFIIGFGIIGASASIFFGQMEREYEKRQALFDQELRLNSLRSHILTSVVLLDDVLFKSNTSAISKMLAVNEDTLSAFASFQASAEVNELLNDVHLAREIEPVVYRLRNDFYTAVSLFRKGQIERAKDHTNANAPPHQGKASALLQQLGLEPSVGLSSIVEACPSICHQAGHQGHQR